MSKKVILNSDRMLTLVGNEALYVAIPELEPLKPVTEQYRKDIAGVPKGGCTGCASKKIRGRHKTTYASAAVYFKKIIDSGDRTIPDKLLDYFKTDEIVFYVPENGRTILVNITRTPLN